MQVRDCPVCAHPNPITSHTCLNCDSTIGTSAPIRDATSRDMARLQELGATNKLDDTSGNDNFDISNYLDNDPPRKTNTQTKYLGQVSTDEESELGTGNLKIQGDLILTEERSKNTYHIPRDDLNEVVVGRSDPATGFHPTIDLSTLGALEHGVSRHHASIMLRDHYLVLVDHKSTNGTYLNGQRLVPGQPRIIRDQDSIRFGQITLNVSYQQQ